MSVDFRVGPSLLRPCHWREQDSSNDAEECRNEMPDYHQCRSNAPRRDESHELVDLVEVILRLDVVFGSVLWLSELKDGGECHWSAVEGYEPDGEDL